MPTINELEKSQEFKDFVDVCTNIVNKGSHDRTLIYKRGIKYIKIIMVNKQHKQGSAWAFVSLEGNIYKSASWSAPAKHSRGNINRPLSYQNYSWAGPYYLK